MTGFEFVGQSGGYAAYAAHESGGAATLYLLAPAPSGTPQALDFSAVWAAAKPWALIVRADAWDLKAEPPEGTAKALALPTARADRAVLAWRGSTSGGAAPVYQALDLAGGAHKQTVVTSKLTLANLALDVLGGTAVDLASDGASLTLKPTSGQFTLRRDDVRIDYLNFGEAVLSLAATDGVAAGGLRAAPVSWSASSTLLLGMDASVVKNRATLTAFDMPEIRYWSGEDPETATRLRLPLFEPVSKSSPDFNLDFTLNPALPFQASATRFDVAQATSAPFTSSAGFLAPDGSAIALSPVSGIGFHLSPGRADGLDQAQLTPYGRFSMTCGGKGVFKLMPGLSGLEFVRASKGDLLDLVPGGAAFAHTAGATTKLLADRTTSWLRFASAGSAACSYFAQPSTSVFYASADGAALPRAADAKIADLTAAGPAFPVAPFGQAFATRLPSPPPADALATLDREALTGARGRVLGGGSPVFSLDGAAIGRASATPQGLVADVGPAPASSPARAEGLAAPATPDGQWRTVHLAKGETLQATLQAGASGAIEPSIASALLQPDLFMVYGNWTGHPIGCEGRIDVGGFTFDWAPVDDVTPMLLVAKFSDKASLSALFDEPEHWRDPAAFVGDAAAIDKAQKAFADALKTARDARKAGSALFDDFLDRVASSPDWTGLLVLGAPVDGNAMPPTLQILVAGMRAPLRAHHIAVDVSSVASKNGVPQDPGPSSIVGVISYDDPGDGDPPAGDFGFYTQSLKVGILNSVVASFHAEVGVTAKALFGREVALRPVKGDPSYADTFLLKGIYHIVANVPTVSFEVPEARVFDFTRPPSAGGGALPRVLDRIEIDAAGIMPQGETSVANGATEHVAQITLDGRMWFAADPFALGDEIDLFSYGGAGEAGLALNNFGLRMTFTLDEDGRRAAAPELVVDYERMTVSDPHGALRPGGLVGGLPFKLKSIAADDGGLTSTKSGGKRVHMPQLAAFATEAPHYALQFELIIGSLGELSGVHAGLTAEMRLAWGPLPTTPDADGVMMTISLPGASGGFDGMQVQGMLGLSFGDANLMRVPRTAGGGAAESVYAILFNNVALDLMGLKLPPKVVSDLILFSDPSNATGSNLAACLAVRET